MIPNADQSKKSSTRNDKILDESLTANQAKIISRLQALSKKFEGKTLTSKMINIASMKGQCPCIMVIEDHFGSLGSAMKKAKLDFQDLTREGMIKQLQELAKILNRTPLHKELDEFHRQGTCFSRRQLEQSSFNGYEDIVQKAGLNSNYGRKPIKKTRSSK